MYRIYTKGNYFFAVNEETGAQLEEHAKDVVIKRSTENTNKFSISRLFGLIDISEMKDESGTPYTLQGFIDFKNENTGKFSGTAENGNGNGGGSGSSDLKNLQATATLTLPNDVVVQSGDTFDITPDTIVISTFGDVLQLDEVNRLFTTTNNEQLNLQVRISVPLEDTQGTEETHLVYLQRGNESTAIQTTIASVKGRRFAQTTDAGLVLTYTSGVNDPFNNVGFRIVFQNDGLFPITVRASEARIDFFGVYDTSKTSV